LAVRTLVASGAFTLGTRLLRFQPEAALVGDVLYNGAALAPLVFGAVAGVSARRDGRMRDFGRSWVAVPLIAGALLIGQGGVRGSVTDNTGAVIPGAAVEYGGCTSSSDETGSFGLGNACLPIYRQAFAPADVRVSLTGFTTQHIGIFTVPGVNRFLDVVIVTGPENQVVETFAPFSLVTLLVLPLSCLSIVLPVMWLRIRTRGARDRRPAKG
jgi:hypothetical protein